MATVDKCYIEHQLNGRERKLGQHGLPVDGFCEETNTVYQFHGCYWHQHTCSGAAANNPILKETLDKERYLRSLGYKLKVIWECDWNQQKDINPKLAKFCKDRVQDIIGDASPLTEEGLLNKIKTGELFGLVQCDIEVPAHLKEHFKEMCPIFKNTEVSREELSDHMKSFASETDHLRRPDLP